MDVIGFLYVSLGSSTVQLHDSLGSRRACPCHRLVSVVEMAILLEECILSYVIAVKTTNKSGKSSMKTTNVGIYNCLFNVIVNCSIFFDL
jgi:hypothetical protein